VAWKRVRVVIGVLLALYGTAAAVTYGCQRLAIFPAPGEVRRPALDGASVVEIAGSAGGTVFALHVPAPAGAPTVVHFHGTGEQLADVVYLARALRDGGVGVFAVEYPGYGLARGGTASEAAIYEAADAALAHLRGPLGVPNERVVLQGQSLGSGVAAEMAARGHGSRLVLISPYTSIREMVGRFVPFLPSRLVCRDPFDTEAKAPAIAVPVLIVHGSDDALIPVGMGRRLAKIFPRATLEVLEGAHHNDLFSGRHPSIVPLLSGFARGGP
jgi:uncharacterized protein